MQLLKITLLILFMIGIVSSQNYKKVKIFIGDQRNVQNLINAGIALDHFDVEKDNSIIAFLSDEEFTVLSSLGIRNEVLIDDWFRYYANLQTLSSSQVSDLIEDSRLEYGVAGFHLGSMGGYMTLDEVYAELDTLKNLFPLLITTKQSLGNSIENRPVYVVKISDNPDVDENEPEVLYTALHHAREPMGMMQMIYFMYYLLENYDSDPAIHYLVDNRELYFIPVVNPDGYEYNKTTNPSGGGMWRKNRRNNGSSYGVDLNRNYGPYDYWSAPNGGSSTNPSSDTYRGTTPFSEPETQIIKNFLASRKIKNALNYHTHGNLLIYPYGALSYETPDSLTFREYAADMTSFNEYAYGTDMQTVGYSTRGNSDDFFYDGDTVANSGKIFTMTPEVGSSSDGFWPAQSRIFPLAQENLHPNLYYAWVAGEYISIDNPNFSQNYFISGETIQFHPSLKNKGLSTGHNIQLELTSLSSYVTVISGLLNIDSVESRSIRSSANPFSFTISPSTLLETKIDLLFTTSSQYVIMSADTVSIFIGQPEYFFADTSSSPLVNWTITSSPSSPAWESTTNTFYSSPSCYTDSKSGSYANNATVMMTLIDPVDLSGYNNPILTFWTKYEIESNWDYGQVEVSTNNGSTWNPAAGNHTNSGIGIFQPNGQPLYDGTQSSWVKENISLSAFISNQVKIRFKLRTDGSDQRDGWYLDDIGILAYSAIPVELISFTADVEGIEVKLEWKTATELNNYGFEIERASSMASPIQCWERIGFIPGTGNSTSLKNYSFTDNTNKSSGKFGYRLKQIDFDGSFKYSKEIEIITKPIQFSLEQNFPNPFNPSTVIRFNIPQASSTEGRNIFVTLKIYDVLGNEVMTLLNEEKSAGKYEVEFNAAKLPNGVYFYKLQAGKFILVKKLILLR